MSWRRSGQLVCFQNSVGHVRSEGLLKLIYITSLAFVSAAVISSLSMSSKYFF